MNTAKQQVIRNMENRRNINSWNRRLKCWGFQAVLMCILLCFLSGCNLSQDDIIKIILDYIKLEFSYELNTDTIRSYFN